MSVLYLVRHATAEGTGSVLSGRTPGVHLNDLGRKQAARLAERLHRHHFQQLFTSPLERTRETAEVLAQTLGLTPQLSPALQEIDFGDWTGSTFAELQPQEAWQRWNTLRGTSRPPNGESMLNVQSRMVQEAQRLAQEFPQDTLLLVSHGDPIKSLLAYHLGMPLDLLHRLEISPASFSILELGNWSPRVLCLNTETPLDTA